MDAAPRRSRRRDGDYDAETARRAAAPRVAAASRSTSSTSPAIAGHENRSAAARRLRGAAAPRSSGSAQRLDERRGERGAVVDGDEPAGLAVVDDPRRALRRRRRPAAARTPSPRRAPAEALAARREREQVGGAEQLGQRLLRRQPASRTRLERRAARSSRGMLALGLARVAADEDERRGRAGMRGRRRRERLDQQRQPLDRGEAPDVEQHRAGGGTPPSSRRPRRAPRSTSAAEDLRVEAVRERDEPLLVDAEQLRPRASTLPGAAISREHAAAQPRSRSAQAAACGQSAPSSISSSISSSVPCRCPTTGTSGATRAAAAFSGVR